VEVDQHRERLAVANEALDKAQRKVGKLTEERDTLKGSVRGQHAEREATELNVIRLTRSMTLPSHPIVH
jgi:hypothetical protein